MTEGMEADESALIGFCEATARLLALPLESADRTAVLANLRVIARQIKFIGDFPPDDQIEPAPVFRA